MEESRVAWSSLLGRNEAGEYTSVSGRAHSLKVHLREVERSWVPWSSLLGGNEAGEYTSVPGRAHSLKVHLWKVVHLNIYTCN